MEANLGFNPVSDGTNIRVPVPPLTEERRRDFVKIVKKFGEDSKVAVRNIRRDGNEHLKRLQKDKKISEDQLKEGEDKIQKITDDHVKFIDDVLKVKEKEIMEV
jgi:ribosome recycling factor